MKNIEFWAAKMQLADDHLWAFEHNLCDRRLRVCGVERYQQFLRFSPSDFMPAYPNRYHKASWDVGAEYTIEEWTRRVLDIAQSNFWLRKAVEKAFKKPLAEVYHLWERDAE